MSKTGTRSYQITEIKKVKKPYKPKTLKECVLCGKKVLTSKTDDIFECSDCTYGRRDLIDKETAAFKESYSRFMAISPPVIKNRRKDYEKIN